MDGRENVKVLRSDVGERKKSDPSFLVASHFDDLDRQIPSSEGARIVRKHGCFGRTGGARGVNESAAFVWS